MDARRVISLDFKLFSGTIYKVFLDLA